MHDGAIPGAGIGDFNKKYMGPPQATEVHTGGNFCRLWRAGRLDGFFR